MNRVLCFTELSIASMNDRGELRTLAATSTTVGTRPVAEADRYAREAIETA